MQHRTQSICPTRAKNFFYWSPHYFPSNEWPLGLLEGLIYTVGIVCTIWQVCKHDFLNNAIYLKEYSTLLREIWWHSILRNLACLEIWIVHFLWNIFRYIVQQVISIHIQNDWYMVLYHTFNLNLDILL